MKSPAQTNMRLTVAKTYKLFIGGAFPRTESGRSVALRNRSGEFVANASRASRKDLREAVVAARKAAESWAGRTAYLRSQILYRAAEMMESRRESLTATLVKAHGKTAKAAEAEVSASIDRLVWYAGWCDKLTQVLGNQNPVAGPFFNMSSPEATGVVVLFAGESSPLLGLVSIVAPVICGGNAVVACSPIAHAPIVIDFAEVLATSDLPAGVVNLLTGNRDELLPTAATHRDIDAIGAVGLSMEEQVLLEGGASATIKRVWIDTDRTSTAWALADHQSLYRITPFLEVKTSWHPMGL